MNRYRTEWGLGVLGAMILSVLAGAAAATAAIPKKDVWYTQHYMIMQDFERKLYRDLSEEGRKGFQDLFWAARTAEARVKYKARMEFVVKNYKTENRNQPWNTDRGRTYLLNGPPASIDYDQRVDLASIGGLTGPVRDVASSNEDVGANRAEVWVYPYDQFFIKYTFYFVQPSQWRITQTTGSRYLGELENFNKKVTFGAVDEAKYKADLALLDKKK
jgi:GWxTD domain-containing protein